MSKNAYFAIEQGCIVICLLNSCKIPNELFARGDNYVLFNQFIWKVV
jgi:hypothetical protein